MANIVKAAVFRSLPVILPGAADVQTEKIGREASNSDLSATLKGFEPTAVVVEAITGTAAAARSPVDEKKAADIEAEARDRGYREGYEAGSKSAQEEWRTRIDRLDRVIVAFEDAQAECLANAEDDAVAIAFEAALRMLGDKRASLDVVAEVVSSVRGDQSSSEPITVRVNSNDYEALIAEPAIIALEDEQQKIRLIEDPRITMGGCIVETDRGALDARIETQIDRLRKTLLEARAAGQ
jgi:flagellar biosynthesis/type III secretory pathway protein FliH